MKKAIILFVAAILAATTTTAAALQQQQQAMSQKLIRLHVVANSDAKLDQELKLQVRDAVLRVTQGLESKEAFADVLPQIRTVAEACILENGFSYPVQVSLEKENFPTRIYGTFSLPAGVYTALRVTIGKGEGHNWWCVAFPSICLRAASAEVEQVAVAAGFTHEEIGLITQEEPQYILKFKALELLQQFKQQLFDKSSAG